MLIIDSLRIRLPAHLRPYAAEVGRRVAEALGSVEPQGLRTRPTLRLPPVRVSPSATAGDVASAVASSIAARLAAASNRGPGSP